MNRTQESIIRTIPLKKDILFAFSWRISLYLSQLFLQVVGWRLSNEGGSAKLQCLWKLKDFKSGVELINRIFNVVESTGHLPNIHLEPPNQVRAELWTPSIGMRFLLMEITGSSFFFFKHFESNTICSL